METVKEMTRSVRNDLVPQFSILRRVPVRYRRILPLGIMKRYQCAVVGAAHGILTVAITDRQNTSILEVLSRLTGHPIFPVWVDPTRMRLFIRRIERYQCRKSSIRRQFFILDPLQVHTMVMFLTSQN